MTSLETKFVKSYLKRGCAGGRGALARALDFAALRLLIFFAAFLLFRQRVDGFVWSLALALLTLLLACVLLYMLSEVRMERYQKKELLRIKKCMLGNRLALLNRDALRTIARPLCGDLPPAFVFSVQPVTADMLLPLARKKRAVAVVAPAGYCAQAESFAADAGLTLVRQAALLKAAEEGGLMPDDAAAFAHMAAEERARREKRKKLGGLPFMQGSAKKYLFTAAVLFGLSFLTRYTLYYRMLATLCMSIFSVNFLIDRTRAPRAGIE